MKRLYYVLIPFIGFFLFSFMPTDNIVSLEQAIKSGQISCAVSVNNKSTHYIKPLTITVNNIKSTPVKVRVPNGYQFFPDDPLYQNIIVTQEEMLAINPGKSVTIELFGMCTENSDRAPSVDVNYKIGKQADEKVTKLTQYIAQKKLHDPLGQSAVWAMTCNTPLEDIVGFDTTASRELVKYVANALGKPVPPPPAQDDTRRNYYASNYSITIRGAFNYEFSKTCAVTIGMFNKNNIIVRELYRNSAEKPGKHKLEYKFDAEEYTDDFYYMRLIVDGEIILSSKMDNMQEFRRN